MTAALTVGAILGLWMTGVILYRWTWGRWLQVWAWPSALGFCLLGKRAARWESGYTRPFLVGRLYDRDEKPGPYMNGHYDGSQLAGLAKAHPSGSQRPSAKTPPTEEST